MNRKIGVILSYALMIFEVLSTLLLTPFIIRTLGQAEFGVYKLTVAITAYLMLLDLGVGNSTIRYIAKYRASQQKEKENQFMAVAIMYYAIIAVLSIVGGIVLIRVFPAVFAKGLTFEEVQLAQRLLWLTVLNVAVTLGTSVFNNFLIAYERFYVAKGSAIVQIILRMILTYIALKLGMGSYGITLITLCLTVLNRLYMMVFVLKRLQIKPTFCGVTGTFVRDITGYSSLILLQMIATQINASADQLLLGSLVRNSSVLIAVYGIGIQIIHYYQSIGNAFNGVLMPGIVRMIEEDGSPSTIMSEMVRIGRIIFMGLVLIWSCFLLYGKNFIILWAGYENRDAYYVAAILMLAYMFMLSESIGSQILWAMNQHREQAILKLAVVMLNIVLTVCLIKWRPLIGATIGTFISLVVGDIVVMNLIVAKKTGISLGKYYLALCQGIVPAATITLLGGLLIKKVFVSNGWIGFFAHVLAMCLIYLVCMLGFGMNSYEKKFLHSLKCRNWRTGRKLNE